MKGHARDLMSGHVQSAPPEATLRELAELLTDGPFGGLPIVSPSLEVIGFVSATDVMRAIRAGKPSSSPASAIMSIPADTIDEFATADQVMQTLTDRCIHHLPVVRGGKLVGIISPKDIVRYFVTHTPPDADAG